MIHYNDKFLSRLEKEIRFAYNDKYDIFDDYTHYGCLLELRKNMLNDQALTRKNQEELLPHIITFKRLNTCMIARMNSIARCPPSSQA